MENKLSRTRLVMAVICALTLLFAGNLFAQDTITIAGSSTVRPVVSTAATTFGPANSVTFKIEGGGSSLGVKSVAEGKVDIGNASRFLKDKEKSKWPNLVPHLIGNDAVAIIVNSHAGIEALTKEQVQAIYTGKIANWKELGGLDLPISLISKEHGRSTLDLFLKYAGLEAKETGKYMVHRIKGEQEFSTVKARIIGANQQVLAQVAGKKGGIGYVSIGDAFAFAKKTKKILIPSLDGVKATLANVKNTTFPICRPLHVVTNGLPQGVVKKFIDYLLSTEGQKLVIAKSFIPVK